MLASFELFLVIIKHPFYKWEEDETSGEEIFKEDFVLETITIAFAKYLEATGNANY